MAEEQEGGATSVKGIIITAVSTVVLGVAGYVTKLITGESDEAAPAVTSAPAPVININQAAAQPAPAPKTVIINKTAPAASAPAPKPKAPTAKEELEKAPQW